jgi:2-haloacid dehalogenase
MVKPDPEIYLHLLSTCGLSAESCLFIDDVARNVEAARQIGLQAIQFTEPDIVECQLRGLGLPV